MHLRLALLAGLTTLPLTLAPPAAAAPAAAADSRWGWPLPAPHRVTRGFDPPPQPWLAGHRGIDMAGHPGATVRSAGDGTVSFAGRVAGTPVVSVRHDDGLLTTYEPVAATVRAGQRVARGEDIGTLQGPTLHWGLRRGPDDYLDPLLLVAPTVVRLLPLAGDHPEWVWPRGAPAAVGAVAAVITPWASRRRGRRCRRASRSR